MTTKISAAYSVSSMGARPAQEDHVLVARERGILAVADGFGGPGPGAEASRIACEALRAFLEKEAGDLDATLPFVLRSYFSLVGNVLFNALIHANRKVCSFNRGKNVHESGGASVVAAYLDGSLLAIANVGACSAWLIRGGVPRELVVPKSYARLRDPAGASPSAEWLAAPLMAIGVGQDIEPEIAEYRVEPGDWVLLHTDGITSPVIHAVAELQKTGSGIREASDLLTHGQYRDNASAALVTIR